MAPFRSRGSRTGNRDAIERRKKSGHQADGSQPRRSERRTARSIATAGRLKKECTLAASPESPMRPSLIASVRHARLSSSCAQCKPRVANIENAHDDDHGEGAPRKCLIATQLEAPSSRWQSGARYRITPMNRLRARSAPDTTSTRNPAASMAATITASGRRRSTWSSRKYSTCSSVPTR